MELAQWTARGIQHHALVQQLQDLTWHLFIWDLLKLVVLMLAISSGVSLDPIPLQK